MAVMLLDSSRPSNTQSGPPARPLTIVDDITRPKGCSSLAGSRRGSNPGVGSQESSSTSIKLPAVTSPVILHPLPTTPVDVLRSCRLLCCRSPFTTVLCVCLTVLFTLVRDGACFCASDTLHTAFSFLQSHPSPVLVSSSLYLFLAVWTHTPPGPQRLLSSPPITYH